MKTTNGAARSPLDLVRELLGIRLRGPTCGLCGGFRGYNRGHEPCPLCGGRLDTAEQVVAAIRVAATLRPGGAGGALDQVRALLRIDLCGPRCEHCGAARGYDPTVACPLCGGRRVAAENLVRAIREVVSPTGAPLALPDEEPAAPQGEQLSCP
jgi:hypothetical protein